VTVRQTETLVGVYPQFKVQRKKKAVAALQDTGVVPEGETDKKLPTEDSEPVQQEQQIAAVHTLLNSRLASTRSDFTRLLHEYVAPSSQLASVESSVGDPLASQSRSSSPC